MDDYTKDFDENLNRKDSLTNYRMGENTSTQELLDIIANSGAFDFTGEISGKNTADVAAAFGDGANKSTIITDLINSRFDSANKNILAEFSFGVSGALQIGTYSSGVSGDVRISPSGIVARDKNNNTTFSLDGTTGDAVYSGTVTAAQVTAGTFTGFTFQTSSTGSRIVLSYVGDDLKLYNSAGDIIFTLNDSSSTVLNAQFTGASQSFLVQNISSLQYTGNLLEIDVVKSDSTGSCLYMTNVGTGEVARLVALGTGEALVLIGNDNITQSISHDNGSYSALYIDNNASSDGVIDIDLDASSGNNCVGIKMNITNSGLGVEYAFDFQGSEYDGTKTAVSGLTGVIKVLAEGLGYIPVYDTAT